MLVLLHSWKRPLISWNIKCVVSLALSRFPLCLWLLTVSPCPWIFMCEFPGIRKALEKSCFLQRISDLISRCLDLGQLQNVLLCAFHTDLFEAGLWLKVFPSYLGSAKIWMTLYPKCFLPFCLNVYFVLFEYSFFPLPPLSSVSVFYILDMPYVRSSELELCGFFFF